MTYTLLLVDSRQENIDVFKNIVWGKNYTIHVSLSGQEGISYIKQNPVHVIFIANQLPDLDGSQFIQMKNQHTNAESIPLFMLSDENDYKTRIQHMSEGIDDYMILPVEPEELKIRTRILIEEVYQPSNLLKRSMAGFTGNLNEMSLLDLLQSLELGQKTATIRLHRAAKEARVYVDKGVVYDAELNSKLGEDALFTLFTWTDGYFFVEFTSINRERKIQISSEELILQGMKILETLTILRGEFTNLYAIPKMKSNVKKDAIEKKWTKLIPLIDGKKNLKRIIETSLLDELQTLSYLQKMRKNGILELEITEEMDFLNFEDSVFTGDMYISNEELNHAINSFIDGLVGKHRSVDHADVITKGTIIPQHDGEKIRSDLIFDKIELQYIKRKLL